MIESEFLESVAFVVLRIEESSDPDKGHEEFQKILADRQSWKKEAIHHSSKVHQYDGDEYGG